MSNDTQYELLTIYRGRNSITYLLSEWEELGEDATPYAIRQNPSENAPFHKFTLRESEAVALQNSPKVEGSSGKWDVEALRKLRAGGGSPDSLANTKSVES